LNAQHGIQTRKKTKNPVNFEILPGKSAPTSQQAAMMGIMAA